MQNDRKLKSTSDILRQNALAQPFSAIGSRWSIPWHTMLSVNAERSLAVCTL